MTAESTRDDRSADAGPRRIRRYVAAVGWLVRDGMRGEVPRVALIVAAGAASVIAMGVSLFAVFAAAACAEAGETLVLFGREIGPAGPRELVTVALVAFAHDATSGRCLVEAIVSVRSSFALEARPSFVGKLPATLEEIAGRSIDPAVVADAIADGYRALTDDVRAPDQVALAPLPLELPAALAAPWAATREEAIGTIGAGRDDAGHLRVGGELMASRDAIARLVEEIFVSRCLVGHTALPCSTCP